MTLSWVECLLEDLDKFRAEYWQQRPWRGHVEANVVQEFFGLADVDRMITTGFTRTPFFRLVKDGRELPASEYTRTMTVSSTRLKGFPDISRTFRHLQDGASLVLDAVHHGVPAVADVTHDFATAFGQVVQANAYITPPESRGLNVHYDRDDVFVVQCFGRKSWQVYEPVVPLPLTGNRVDPESLGPPAYEQILTEGDILYVPRGWPHVATAAGTTSCHLSIGILTLTVADALEALLKSVARRQQSLRRELPLTAEAESDAVALLLEAVQWLASHAEEQDALATIGEYRAHIGDVNGGSEQGIIANLFRTLES